MRYTIFKWILLLLSIVFVGFVLFSVVRVGLVFGLYAYITSWVTVRLGLDYYIAQLISLILTALATLILPSITWFLISGKRRIEATVAIIGSMALVCVLVYTVGQDVYFDRQTGNPLRYYADTPEGRRFSFTPGFEPKSGIEFKPYTRDVANKFSTLQPQSGTIETPVVEKWALAQCEPQKVFGSKYVTRNGGFFSDDLYYGVRIWVEGVGIVGDKTVLRLASEYAGNTGYTTYLKNASEAYITDSNGNIYNILEDRGTYGSFFSGYSHEIREPEIYRFELAFPKLAYDTPFVTLKHPHFPLIKVKLDWKS